MFFEIALQTAVDDGGAYVLDAGDGGRYMVQLSECYDGYPTDGQGPGSSFWCDTKRKVITQSGGGADGWRLLYDATPLALYRRVSRLTVATLARRSGVRKSVINNLECGKLIMRRQRAETVYALARVLDTTMETLLETVTPTGE